MSGVILNPRGRFCDDDSDDYDEDDSGYYGPYNQQDSSRHTPIELRNRDPMEHIEEELLAQTQMDAPVPVDDGQEVPDEETAPPVDLKKDAGLLYSAVLMIGVAVLIPYYAIETASDYYRMRFPDYNIIFDIHMAYMACTIGGVLFGNLFVEAIAFQSRIMGGIGVALASLMFVTVFDMLLELFDENKGYEVTLAAVGICALGTSGRGSK
jgi:hypothetical protein